MNGRVGTPLAEIKMSALLDLCLNDAYVRYLADMSERSVIERQKVKNAEVHRSLLSCVSIASRITDKKPGNRNNKYYKLTRRTKEGVARATAPVVFSPRPFRGDSAG